MRDDRRNKKFCCKEREFTSRIGQQSGQRMWIERSIKSMWRHDMKTTTWVRGSRQLATVLVLAIGSASITSPVHAEQTDLLERIKSTGIIRIANTQASPPWSML